MSIITIVLALLMSATPTQVEFVGGKRLAELGKAFQRMEAKAGKDDDHLGALYFLGYVAAIADTGGKNELFCIPNDVSIQQVATVVARFVDAHPETWHFRGYYFVEGALAAAFPCS
ncbi:Rap1a/Tai family immunity protein [Tahibacter amnicola]|uniref:Rap1a/Tai family immunity protein n=1 Tax=Tahibacter amnicola TaxID=2976241 RepID=A0ABY6BLK2_9GAMM|nr:Rap1a/Tai family immunity protein [Tahibacter amnicola]UXI70318.1 Rap1a/Tai family immunity protein [Tahibacter amnicola]